MGASPIEYEILELILSWALSRSFLWEDDLKTKIDKIDPSKLIERINMLKSIESNTAATKLPEEDEVKSMEFGEYQSTSPATSHVPSHRYSQLPQL